MASGGGPPRPRERGEVQAAREAYCLLARDPRSTEQVDYPACPPGRVGGLTRLILSCFLAFLLNYSFATCTRVGGGIPVPADMPIIPPVRLTASTPFFERACATLS